MKTLTLLVLLSTSAIASDLIRDTDQGFYAQNQNWEAWRQSEALEQIAQQQRMQMQAPVDPCRFRLVMNADNSPQTITTSDDRKVHALYARYCPWDQEGL